MTDKLLEARQGKARIQTKLESNKLDLPVVQVLAIAFIAGGLASIKTDWLIGTLLLLVGIACLGGISKLVRARNHSLKELLDEENVILEEERREEKAKQASDTPPGLGSAAPEPLALPEGSESTDSGILRSDEDIREEEPE